MKVNLGKYHKNGKPRKQEIIIDPWDTWNLDETLALIIIPCLKQLRDNHHGCARIDNEDLEDSSLALTEEEQKVFDYGIEDGYTKEQLEDIDRRFFARWIDVLNQMIWSFEYTLTGYDNGEFDPEKYDDYLDRHKKLMEKHEKGMKLFAKYYSALWD